MKTDIISVPYKPCRWDINEKYLNPYYWLSFLFRIQDFFDVEAELSGDDDGVDEEEEADSDEAEANLLVDDHELPCEEQLRDEIANLHMLVNTLFKFLLVILYFFFKSLNNFLTS